MGKLIGIATRKEKKARMDEHHSAEITFEKGVAEDSRGLKRNHRQVTVLSKESWHATCQDMRQEIPWTTRRANLLVEGVELINKTGTLLKIGTAIVEITGELEPCKRMDLQVEGLTRALEKDWRGGVTCKIVKEGIVRVNDTVTFVRESI